MLPCFTPPVCEASRALAYRATPAADAAALTCAAVSLSTALEDQHFPKAEVVPALLPVACAPLRVQTAGQPSVLGTRLIHSEPPGVQCVLSGAHRAAASLVPPSRLLARTPAR